MRSRSSVERKKKTHTHNSWQEQHSPWEHHHLRHEEDTAPEESWILAMSEPATSRLLPVPAQPAPSQGAGGAGRPRFQPGQDGGRRGLRPGCRAPAAWMQSAHGLGAERPRPPRSTTTGVHLHPCLRWAPRRSSGEGLPGSHRDSPDTMWCHSWNRSLVLPWKISLFVFLLKYANLLKGQWKKKLWVWGLSTSSTGCYPWQGASSKAWIQNTTVMFEVSHWSTCWVQ